ncbi:MAG: acetyl-CoA decarbonylase/synthase complex subunit gamma [Anaerolineae bacterium]|nr:acetyl-CoA decarbonylase/synthase complex subunit gamma [Anaerolineae bacterium]
MALSGIQIYKLLPKTNCKECGYPTCLAFAMKLAAKQANLDACPYVSEESRSQLEAASQPPIHLVKLRSNEREVGVGNETAMFRHEKRFYNKPGIFIRLFDDLSVEEMKSQAAEISAYMVEYVGMELVVDGLAIEATGDDQNFATAVEAVHTTSSLPLILISNDAHVMEAGLKALDGQDVRPLIHGATAETWEDFASLAKKYNAAMSIREEYLDVLAQLAEDIKAAGVADIVLDHGARDLPIALAKQTQIRRLALKKNLRELGYPMICFPGESVDDPDLAGVAAAQAIAKYAGFVVLDEFSPEIIYPLLALRENIYTDPQTPIQVQPGLYEIGDPTPDSPLYITTNFSITYFSVANEISGSGVPGWLLVVDAEGMSVLTAWAAGKFDAERVGKAVKSSGAGDKVNHKKLVIPGHAAVMLGEIEEVLPGWKILVGPREAVGIPNFVKVWGTL